jgi:hypothetical protein
MRFGGYAGLPKEFMESVDRRRETAKAILSKYELEYKNHRSFRGSSTYTIVVKDYNPEVTEEVVLYGAACTAFGGECWSKGNGEFSVEVYTS